MGQKFVIINTEAFSTTGLKKQKCVTFEDLPQLVKTFINACPDPFIVLDESSRIKTNTPMAEDKKSTRTRLIKLLSAYGDRMALTGTLTSKSPLNMVDQYQYLDSSAFPEGMFALAERYCIMMTLRTQRGARVLVPEHSGKDDKNSWCGIRKRLARAYAIGGKARLLLSMNSIYRETGISLANLWWIICHKKYRPFKSIAPLMKRFEFCTEVISRDDAFDTTMEKYINKPIVRKVKLSEEAKKLYTQLVTLGFTDNLVLGKAAALELGQRLMDVCNGFEPISSCLSCTEEGAQDGVLHNTCPLHAKCKKPKATFKPLKTNPKLEAVMELVEEIDPEEHQIVIWVCRTNLMELLYTTLEEAGIATCCFSGQQGTKEKKDARDGFMEGRYRICIANQQSAAYGVNFMKNCDYTIYACSNSSVEYDYQSRHRFLRGITTRMKYAYRIYVEGSVEERIYSALDLGNDLIGETNTKEVFELQEGCNA
jgi:hypothetical protein